MSVLTKALAVAAAVLLLLSLALGLGLQHYKHRTTVLADELAQTRSQYDALEAGTAEVGKAAQAARNRAAGASKKVQKDPEARAWAEQELPAAIQEALK